MSIRFGEIKGYLARNVRLSICFEDGHYHNYMMVSDIPGQKYDSFYVYGIGMIDVEFSMDVYAKPQELDGVVTSSRDDTLAPAIEIVLCEKPREIERSTDENLVFRDLKPYLQIGRHFSVVNREDWSCELYEYRNDIPEKYDNMYVYGIGMEDNPDIEECLKEREYDTCLKKRMVIVLSDKKSGTEKAEMLDLVYLLTVKTCDSTSIHGVYKDKSILLKDYDMLMNMDKRFSRQDSTDDIKIYKLLLNKFYGEYMDWLGEDNDQFYEKLDGVDISELRTCFC